MIYAKFGVFTKVILQIQAFCDVSMYPFANGYRCWENRRAFFSEIEVSFVRISVVNLQKGK
jgi:hypothetical protein